VLFDLDDTLVDRCASLLRFAGVLHGAYASRLGDCDPSSIYPLIRAADNGGYRDREAVAQELAEVLPWRDAPAAGELATYWTAEFPRD
jgi:putative hydrolase of the HAD superfamily